MLVFLKMLRMWPPDIKMFLHSKVTDNFMKTGKLLNVKIVKK